MTKYAVFIVILIAAWLPHSTRGALIGDPAEPLTIQEWVKGPPVQIKAGTNIYVVEIWKTTGAASRAAITNLNEIQARFRTNGVVVVGVSDEPVETITNFLQHEGSSITYAVAADQHRATSMAYMEPAGQLGVPYAFVVGTNGQLLWHGHVLRGLDTALEQIVGGNFNLPHAQAAEVAHRQLEQYIALSRRGDGRTRAAGMVLLAARTNDVDLLCDMALEICTDPQIRNRDFPLAAKALQEAQKLVPTNSPRLMIYKAVWLFQSGKYRAGLTLGQRALDAAQTPAEKINIQSMLGTMKARVEMLKAQHSQTNQLNKAQSPSPASGTVTNRPPAANPKP
ncbi:MAG: redoxin domain-containing protein [Verrucomicrobiota bacterium]|jgi:hypothetical protein